MLDRSSDICRFSESPAGARACLFSDGLIEARRSPAASGHPDLFGRARLAELLAETQADEIIAVAQIYDHEARLHSFELAAEALRSFVRA